MIIGFTALIFNYVLTENSGFFYLIWGGIFAFGGLSTAYKATIGTLAWKKKWFAYNTQTLDWYKMNYSQHTLSNNIVRCCFCENNSINSYYLRNRTYKICNYCAKCGEVLFYSDEHK